MAASGDHQRPSTSGAGNNRPRHEDSCSTDEEDDSPPAPSGEPRHRREITPLQMTVRNLRRRNRELVRHILYDDDVWTFEEINRELDSMDSIVAYRDRMGWTDPRFKLFEELAKKSNYIEYLIDRRKKEVLTQILEKDLLPRMRPQPERTSSFTRWLELRRRQSETGYEPDNEDSSDVTLDYDPSSDSSRDSSPERHCYPRSTSTSDTRETIEEEESRNECLVLPVVHVPTLPTICVPLDEDTTLVYIPVMIEAMEQQEESANHPMSMQEEENISEGNSAEEVTEEEDLVEEGCEEEYSAEESCEEEELAEEGCEEEELAEEGCEEEELAEEGCEEEQSEEQSELTEEERDEEEYEALDECDEEEDNNEEEEVYEDVEEDCSVGKEYDPSEQRKFAPLSPVPEEDEEEEEIYHSA